jgi:hypothetical protein
VESLLEEPQPVLEAEQVCKKTWILLTEGLDLT